MWKVGQTIKCINFYGDTDHHVFTIGNNYKIIEATPHIERIFEDKDGMCYLVYNDHAQKWWIVPNCFKPVEMKKIINEVDWLNRIQENFKD